jgi:hypothetical protein
LALLEDFSFFALQQAFRQSFATVHAIAIDEAFFCIKTVSFVLEFSLFGSLSKCILPMLEHLRHQPPPKRMFYI